MYRFALIATVVVGLFQAISGRASADIKVNESLDLVVMRSDLVVRGEVIEIVSKKRHDGFVWTLVTVRVKETIKGQKFKEVKLAVYGLMEPPGAAWQKGNELLLCLRTFDRKREVLDNADFVIRYAVVLDGKPGLPIYGLDFKGLTDPKEILTAARAAAADPAMPPVGVLRWDLRPGPPQAVEYPDTERVRAAAKKHNVKLNP